MSETILVKPKADTTDPLHDPDGSAAPEPYPVVARKVWPRATQETDRGWVGIEGWGLLCRARSVVPRTARVVFRGDEYEVDGVPQDFGRKGVLVYLTRHSGAGES